MSGTSAAALKRLGENVLCLRLLRHDRLGATNFGLGAAGNDSRIGPGNAAQLVRERPELVRETPILVRDQ